MAIEVPSSTQETLLSPHELKGNVWKFADYNIGLSPSAKAGYTEHRWDTLSPKLAKLIDGLQSAHISRYWKFESALLPKNVSENGWLHIALVFSNPQVDLIEKIRPRIPNPLNPIENFIEERSRYSGSSTEGYLPERQINVLLQGTNFLAGDVQYEFNPVLLEESGGLFKRKGQKEIYYQMGVAYILLNLMPISRAIEEEETSIEEIVGDFHRKLAERREVLAQLRSSQVSDPAKLF